MPDIVLQYVVHCIVCLLIAMVARCCLHTRRSHFDWMADGVQRVQLEPYCWRC